jgi:hydrogenase maturation protease
MSRQAPLVIGYGNPLRTDDGFGWHAATRLPSDRRFDKVEFVACHQLTPELAEKFGRAAVVIFIDANVTGKDPGTVSVVRIERQSRRDAAWSHRCSPQDLLHLAGDLYEHVPPAFVIGVEPADISAGETMTLALERSMPPVADAVGELIAASTIGEERAAKST